MKNLTYELGCIICNVAISSEVSGLLISDLLTQVINTKKDFAICKITTAVQKRPLHIQNFKRRGDRQNYNCHTKKISPSAKLQLLYKKRYHICKITITIQKRHGVMQNYDYHTKKISPSAKLQLPYKRDMVLCKITTNIQKRYHHLQNYNYHTKKITPYAKLQFPEKRIISTKKILI